MDGVVTQANINAGESDSIEPAIRTMISSKGGKAAIPEVVRWLIDTQRVDLHRARRVVLSALDTGLFVLDADMKVKNKS